MRLLFWRNYFLLYFAAESLLRNTLTLLAATPHNLEKLENLFKQLGYRVRYEKGNFKTGACVLQNSKVVVVNRFIDTEAKIGALTDLMAVLPLDPVIGNLDEKQKQLLLSIRQIKLEI